MLIPGQLSHRQPPDCCSALIEMTPRHARLRERHRRLNPSAEGKRRALGAVTPKRRQLVQRVTRERKSCVK